MPRRSPRKSGPFSPDLQGAALAGRAPSTPDEALTYRDIPKPEPLVVRIDGGELKTV